MRMVIPLGLVLALLSPSAALTASKPARVGIVLPGDEWRSAVDGLKEGMKALGYVQDKDIEYLLDNARGDKKKVAATTERFAAEKVDVIFTITNTALKIVLEAARASRTPVVFGSASGPVESGIVPAYASQDKHIVTGVTSGSIELVAKRLEILTEVLPRARRVALIGDLDSDSSKASFAIAKQAGAKLGLTLIEHRVTSRDQAIEAAKKTTRREADALFLVPGLHGVGATREIALAAKAARIPFAVYQVEHVRKDGALFSYGSSYFLQGKQSAALVHKILRGMPASQLPIERPRVHELILNLDTAKEIGITFSAEILNRADELVNEGGRS